jgi:hypothetical protein
MHWVGLELLVFFELDLALAVGVFILTMLRGQYWLVMLLSL